MTLEDKWWENWEEDNQNLGVSLISWELGGFLEVFAPVIASGMCLPIWLRKNK